MQKNKEQSTYKNTIYSQSSCRWAQETLMVGWFSLRLQHFLLFQVCSGGLRLTSQQTKYLTTLLVCCLPRQGNLFRRCDTCCAEFLGFFVFSFGTCLMLFGYSANVRMLLHSNTGWHSSLRRLIQLTQLILHLTPHRWH